MIRIHIPTQTPDRTPLPADLRGLAMESLRDLSWTDPSLGYTEYGWWPEERQWPDLAEGERYTDETLTADAELGVVISARGAEPDPDYVAPVPHAVSRAQGKAALVQAGLYSMVLDYVASITDPTDRALAEIALHDTQEWRRDSPFLADAADAIGLTPTQLDDLFRYAADILL